MKTLKLLFERKIKPVLNQIKNWFIKLYIRFCGRPGQLKKAIREAKKLHQEHGRRYRVFFFGYKYRVWNRDDIRRQIKSGLLKDGLKAGSDFDTICYFDTNDIEPKIICS